MHVCEEYREEKVRGCICAREKYLSLSGNDARLHVICGCGQGGHNLFLFLRSNGAARSFPRNLCGLLSQSCSTSAGTSKAGDTERWGTVTPSERHCRDSQAWECPQSKPQANYSCNLCNCHLLKLEFKALNVIAIYCMLSLALETDNAGRKLFIL